MSGLPGLPIVLLYRGLHGLQLGEVLAHVRVQDHVDDQVAKIAKISLLHVGENVAVVLFDHPKERKICMKFCSSLGRSEMYLRPDVAIFKRILLSHYT